MEHFQFIPPVVLVDPPPPPASHLCSGATCSVCVELKIGMFARHRDCSKDGPFATKQPEIELIKITDELHEAVESIPAASGASKAAVQEDVVGIASKVGARASDGEAAEPVVNATVAVASSRGDASMPVLEDVSKQVESDHLTGNTSQQDKLGEIVDMAIGCTRPCSSQPLLENKLEGNDCFAGNPSQQDVTSEEPKVCSSVPGQGEEGSAEEDGGSVPFDANIKIKQEKADDDSGPEIKVLSVRYNYPGMCSFCMSYFSYNFVDAGKTDQQPSGGHKRNSGVGKDCDDIGPVPKAARGSVRGGLGARNVEQGPDGPVGAVSASPSGEMEPSDPLFQAFLGFMHAFRGYRGGGERGTWSRRRGGRRPPGGPGGRGGRRPPGGSGRPWQRGPRRSWW